MILILGGAGYIGSHVNKLLHAKGYETLVLDNLVYGHRRALKWGIFFEGEINDNELLTKIFKEYPIEAVMHFAAFIDVGGSMVHPERFYRNNVLATAEFLNAMLDSKYLKKKNFIFSSTAAIYGIPEVVPIPEDHRTDPINSYGDSKLMVEKILEDYSEAYDFNYVSLRYFNAAGADPEGDIGEDHKPETHLIPLILDAALGEKENIKIFGTDYNTPDGTCVRDYIHVNDLAQAHILALENILFNHKSDVFNLGNGMGHSVREVIETTKKITQKNFEVVESDRRRGDVAYLVGSSDKAKEVLKWKPKFEDLNVIIETAWKWHQKKYSV